MHIEYLKMKKLEKKIIKKIIIKLEILKKTKK